MPVEVKTDRQICFDICLSYIGVHPSVGDAS